MTPERNDPARSGATVLLGGEQYSYSKNGQIYQRRLIPPMPDPASAVIETEAGKLPRPTVANWRDFLISEGFFRDVEVLSNDLGPIALIGSPRVVIGRNLTHTTVWVERPSWGKGNHAREFLHAPLHSKSKAAARYADELRQMIADAAHAEQARQTRAKTAYQCEKAEGFDAAIERLQAEVESKSGGDK